jgi:hypothetical protein
LATSAADERMDAASLDCLPIEVAPSIVAG